MKRAFLLTLLLTSSALAHELQRDGNVGALLHIEPDDDPVVGKPNATWFELNKKGGTPIALEDCRCTLQVYLGSVKAGSKPLSTPLLKQGKNSVQASITFPRDAAYTLVLSGKPKTAAAFNAFTLQWVVRAGPGGGIEDHDHD